MRELVFLAASRWCCDGVFEPRSFNTGYKVTPSSTFNGSVRPETICSFQFDALIASVTMSSKNPAGTDASPTADLDTTPHVPDTADTIDLPRGWKYRRIHLFGKIFPWYASPRIQLGMVAFVCFMCPGMFNALGGMGGGGKTDATLADNMVSN